MENEAVNSLVRDSGHGLSTYRRLLPIVLRHKALLAGWLTFLALSAAAILTLPVVAGYVIDRGLAHADPNLLNLSFVGLVCVLLVFAAAASARYYYVTLLGERVANDLRLRVYERLLVLDRSFFERTRTGELVARLAADAQLVQTMVSTTFPQAVRSAVVLLGSAGAIAVTSWRLAGLTALLLPLVVLPVLLYGRKVQILSRMSQDHSAEATALAAESLNAIHIVQAYTRERREGQRYTLAVSKALTTARQRILATAVLNGLSVLLCFGAIIVVLWAGAHAVLARQIEPGALGRFVLYGIIAADSVFGLTEVWGETLRCAAALGRIGELLDMKPAIRSPVSPKQVSRPFTRLRFEQVEFRYPSRPQYPALSDFDLEVRRGETIALVGPSGAGKSTVFQLLLRFYDPQRGRITLGGTDVRALSVEELRSCYALVSQEPLLFGTSAAENIRYGRLDASDADIEFAARAAEAHEFLAALPEGYATEIGERGARLSGGQQQRVAIARALLRNAPILLLDEATSSLDARSEHLLQQAIERLMAGRTTLVIAHRLATVKRADRIIVLDRGRIVAQGRHDELLKSDSLYAELARLQFAA